MPKERAIRLQTLQDVRRLLAKTVNALNRNEITEERARALGYLAGILRDVIKTGDLEARLEALENSINGD